MGWREARMVLTVVSRASGHVSIGPTDVRLQSWERVKSAISPVPKIRTWPESLDGEASEFLREDGVVKGVLGAPENFGCAPY
jgi:hypothetical protein